MKKLFKSILYFVAKIFRKHEQAHNYIERCETIPFTTTPKQKNSRRKIKND